MRRLLAVLAVPSVLAILTAATLAGARGIDRIDLPTGFGPEGIAIGKNSTFYVGSIPSGAIYRGDLRTGEGEILVPGGQGRSAIGLAVDNNEQLFVAGGATGRAYVYDGRTGQEVAVLQLASSAPTFINDVVVTRTDAWFTDSQKAVLYRVPVGPNGEIGAPATVPLGGDFVLRPGFNANGIDATPDASALVIVQSNVGKLFTVDPSTGVADEIELAGGESVPNGDGILLDGKTLYVVQNRLNLVARVDLAPDLRTGEVASRTGSPDFSVPTTVDEHGEDLWFVNARFGVPGPAAFWLTRLAKP